MIRVAPRLPPRRWSRASAVLVAACGGADSERGVVEHRRQRAARADVQRRQEVRVRQARPLAPRRPDRRPGNTARSTLRLSGPFQAGDAGELPKFQLDVRLRGRRPEHRGRRDVDRRQGLRHLPGPRLRRLRPGLPAVQGRLRGGREEVGRLRRRARRSPRSASTRASGSPTRATPARRRWATTDTIKITGGVDVSKLLDDINAALGKVGRSASAAPARCRTSSRRRRRTRSIDGGQGPARRDLHGQGRPDPAPDRGRRGRQDDLRQHGGQGRARHVDHRRQRGPGHLRARPTRSRSTSCSRSSAG